MDSDDGSLDMGAGGVSDDGSLGEDDFMMHDDLEMTEEQLAKRAAEREAADEAKARMFMNASQGILDFEPGEDLIEPEPALPATEEEPADVADADDNGHRVPQQLPPSLVSSRRHSSMDLGSYAEPLLQEGTVIGIKIQGFEIETSQGPMGDEAWYETHTSQLEDLTQPATPSNTTRRKLGLPEMVFPFAHLALKGHGLVLRWDVISALTEWAECHQAIEVGSATDSHPRGVSVLQAKDASLWEKKAAKLKQSDPSETSSLFHYDWTYSTPYCGTCQGGSWHELDESGMRMSLLTDESVPILFFDQICLFEDDLHDNGQVEYSVKMRVMPSCAFIVARLYVRVDQVVLRVRETRVLVDFFGITPRVYRDVTWRECKWEDLASHSLPTDTRAWVIDSGKGETAAFSAFVKQLPAIELPPGLAKHAIYEKDGKQED